MSVETLNVLKKILGKLPKTSLSSYDYPIDIIIKLIAPPEHVFIPNLVVDDRGLSVRIDGFIHYLKVEPNYAPCKFNIDRDVTDREYSVVFPGTIKVVSRYASKIYLRAPQGQTSCVTIESLKVS